MRRWISREGIILLALALSIVFVSMRALATLGPSNLRWMLPLGFCIIAALPWLLLAPAGAILESGTNEFKIGSEDFQTINYGADAGRRQCGLGRGKRRNLYAHAEYGSTR